MAPKDGDFCEESSKCPAVKAIVEQTNRMEEDQAVIHAAFEEGTRQLTSVTMQIVEATSAVNNLATSVEKYEGSNTKDHDEVFGRLRTTEIAQAVAEVTVANVGKLSLSDLLKIVGGIGTILFLYETLTRVFGG